MKQYIYIVGSLVPQLERERVKKLTSKDVNFNVGNFTQVIDDKVASSDGGMITFIECLDPQDELFAGLEIITETDAEALINAFYKPKYMVENEGLMNANINQLVTNGTLDLTNAAEFDGAIDTQAELAILYETYNVSGIVKSIKPSLA